MPRLADAVGEWHSFYMLLGSASATLIGLLFVAVSVGSGYYNQSRKEAARSFLSPTVVHFSCVLTGCLIAICPLRGWTSLGCLIGGDGLFGVVYAGAVWRGMVRHGFSRSIDLEDRIYYAALPAVGYMVMAAAGIAFALQMRAGCTLLASAMGLLTLVGIRNAWDITLWTVVKQRE